MALAPCQRTVTSLDSRSMRRTNSARSGATEEAAGDGPAQADRDVPRFNPITAAAHTPPGLGLSALGFHFVGGRECSSTSWRHPRGPRRAAGTCRRGAEERAKALVEERELEHEP